MLSCSTTIHLVRNSIGPTSGDVDVKAIASYEENSKGDEKHIKQMNGGIFCQLPQAKHQAAPTRSSPAQVPTTLKCGELVSAMIP
jgi:hypothetical protein